MESALNTTPAALASVSGDAVDAIDPRAFRNTLGHYASGITIIGGLEGDEPVGFTCQSFYSVSTEPPLVSFSVMVNSTTYPRIRETGKFSVNVLSHEQHEISNQFARKGTDKWAGIDWAATANRNPVIADTLMWLDCDIWAEYEAGDHYIVIGRVNEMSSADWHTRQPLLYFKGQYRHLRDVEAAAS
ncbi:flavin reductase [Subtercola boreus]|uniref:Flavin reductase n=1 Tax=Subtercola boreus TaxID=120213 RepID=A0A3E0VP63_9MICO|nr:flavin reductase family protein [Subtercola boreus]RFA10627.1 flavin reductase [Subtercola boreus]TQL55817.1 flavin reductase (DIM6/NTAB) family NADH-FMN oxidoreductase RutF [Subtercola boreus]